MFLPGDTPGKSASIVLPFALFEKGGPWPGRTSRPVAGQDKPARGRAGQAGPWPGKTSRPVAGQDEPASCLRQGRGVAPRASRLLACRKGGGLHPRQAAFLRAARAGGCTPGKPLSCLRQERKFRSCGWAGTRQYAWKTHIVRAPGGGEELSVLGTRCGGGLPRSPREGAAPPSNPSKGGSAP